MNGEAVDAPGTDNAAQISTRQYARLVDEWVTGIGLPGEGYGTHSLRRTEASIIYKATENRRSKFCLGTPSLKARSDTLGWTWATLCSQRAPKSEINWFLTVARRKPRQRGDCSAPMQAVRLCS